MGDAPNSRVRDPLATALNEGLPGTAIDVGHLQRRPVHALCVGSPASRIVFASSGLPVAPKRLGNTLIGYLA
jgi:hypothetical protein